MAELVDALDLGSNEETRTGSSPARPTNINRIAPGMVLFFFELAIDKDDKKWLNEFTKINLGKINLGKSEAIICLSEEMKNSKS